MNLPRNVLINNLESWLNVNCIASSWASIVTKMSQEVIRNWRNTSLCNLSFMWMTIYWKRPPVLNEEIKKHVDFLSKNTFEIMKKSNYFLHWKRENMISIIMWWCFLFYFQGCKSKVQINLSSCNFKMIEPKFFTQMYT